MRHDGKCARLHGHSWVGFLVVAGEYLAANGPKENMLVDYGEMGKVARDIETALDHRHLNEVLGTDMPTSEFVAQWVWREFNARFMELGARLCKVIIEETCTSRCEYEPAP